MKKIDQDINIRSARELELYQIFELYVRGNGGDKPNNPQSIVELMTREELLSKGLPIIQTLKAEDMGVSLEGLRDPDSDPENKIVCGWANESAQKLFEELDRESKRQIEAKRPKERYPNPHYFTGP